MVQDRYVPVAPDEGLRNCPPEPAKPVLHTSADAATAYGDALTWGRACKSQLDGTWKSIDQAKGVGS